LSPSEAAKGLKSKDYHGEMDISPRGTSKRCATLMISIRKKLIDSIKQMGSLNFIG